MSFSWCMIIVMVAMVQLLAQRGVDVQLLVFGSLFFSLLFLKPSYVVLCVFSLFILFYFISETVQQLFNSFLCITLTTLCCLPINSNTNTINTTNSMHMQMRTISHCILCSTHWPFCLLHFPCYSCSFGYYVLGIAFTYADNSWY